MSRLYPILEKYRANIKYSNLNYRKPTQKSAHQKPPFAKIICNFEETSMSKDKNYWITSGKGREFSY